jgi:hypothetical protein
VARTRPFGTVVKLPSGRYRARYWKLGKQVSAPSTFTTKSDARAWLSTIETDLARGVRIDPKAGSVRFDDYAERWMAQRRLRPHTRETIDRSTQVGCRSPTGIHPGHDRRRTPLASRHLGPAPERQRVSMLSTASTTFGTWPAPPQQAPAHRCERSWPGWATRPATRPYDTSRHRSDATKRSPMRSAHA